jgi:hypothetical protein
VRRPLPRVPQWPRGNEAREYYRYERARARASNPTTSAENPITNDPEAAAAPATTSAPERVTERLEAPASEDDPEAKAAAKLPDLLQSDRSMSKETVAQLLKDKHGIVLGVRALQRVLLAVRGKGKPGRRKGSKNKKSQHRVTKSRHPHQLNRDTRTD